MEDIKITVHFTWLVDVKNIVSRSVISIPAGSNLSALLSVLGIREQHKRYIIAMINGKKETMFYSLKEKDEVKLFLPVGGG